MRNNKADIKEKVALKETKREMSSLLKLMPRVVSPLPRSLSLEMHDLLFVQHNSVSPLLDFLSHTLSLNFHTRSPAPEFFPTFLVDIFVAKKPIS